jgi:hypothetical protein
MKVLTSREKIQLTLEMREVAGQIAHLAKRSLMQVYVIAIIICTWHVSKISIIRLKAGNISG